MMRSPTLSPGSYAVRDGIVAAESLIRARAATVRDL